MKMNQEIVRISWAPKTIKLIYMLFEWVLEYGIEIWQLTHKYRWHMYPVGQNLSGKYDTNNRKIISAFLFLWSLLQVFIFYFKH